MSKKAGSPRVEVSAPLSPNTRHAKALSDFEDDDEDETLFDETDAELSAGSTRSVGANLNRGRLMPMNNRVGGPHSHQAHIGLHSASTRSMRKQKSKKEIKEEKKWLKRLKQIGRQHPEFELTYDLLLGIRTSVSLVNNSVLRSSINTSKAPSSKGTGGDSSGEEAEDDDLDREFRDCVKYTFPSEGSHMTPPHKMSNFTFKDYCRQIFSDIRGWCGVTPQAYLIKLCGGFNLLEFISNSKSGQFFFYSYEGDFLIKSMTRSESIFMRKILPAYYNHLRTQPNTLLNRFYGMYRVAAAGRPAIYFVVMGNVFDTDLEIHRIFDLKGSTHGREATNKDKEQDVPVLKDLDFLSERQIIKIGKKKAKLFKDQLRKDTEMLRKAQIMDYSLLLGVHYRDRAEKQKQAPSGHRRSFSSKQLAYSLKDVFAGVGSKQAHAMKVALPEEMPVHASGAEANGVLQQSQTPHTPTASLSEDMTDDEKEEPQRLDPEREAEAVAALTAQSGSTSPVTPLEPKIAGIDEEFEDEDGDTIAPLGSNPSSPNGRDSALNLPLSRVASRRLSQLGMKNTYTVKTPLENKFDVPELIDAKKVGDDEKEIETTNVFAQYHGGVTHIEADGNMGNEVYLFGIIDILQKYNKRKKVENFFRGMKTDSSTISAVPPEVYAKRMYDFLKDKVM